MTGQHVVPTDFPTEPWPGPVSGTRPKLLVREKEGRHDAGLTDDELLTSYEVCDDLARWPRRSGQASGTFVCVHRMRSTAFMSCRRDALCVCSR